jgi:hypothetical protein
MFADVIKFVVAAQPVCEMWRLYRYWFLQWFMSGGCQGYVLVDDTTKT